MMDDRYAPDEVEQYAEILLNKRKVAAQQILGPQVLHDAKVAVVMDDMLGRMLVQLRTYVYAHKVDTQTVRVPFSKTETHVIPAPRRLLWTYAVVVVIGLALTVAFTSLPAFLVTAVVALAAVVVHVANPPREVLITVSGEAVVRRDQFNAFPDNAMVYPDSLGTPVAVADVTSWAPYDEAEER